MTPSSLYFEAKVAILVRLGFHANSQYETRGLLEGGWMDDRSTHHAPHGRPVRKDTAPYATHVYVSGWVGLQNHNPTKQHTQQRACKPGRGELGAALQPLRRSPVWARGQSQSRSQQRRQSGRARDTKPAVKWRHGWKTSSPSTGLSCAG